ncbi:MAG: hypothetical protein ACYC4J_00795 [Gemmatimonadaceae bacterium]
MPLVPVPSLRAAGGTEPPMLPCSIPGMAPMPAGELRVRLPAAMLE